MEAKRSDKKFTEGAGAKGGEKGDWHIRKSQGIKARAKEAPMVGKKRGRPVRETHD